MGAGPEGSDNRQKPVVVNGLEVQDIGPGAATPPSVVNGPEAQDTDLGAATTPSVWEAKIRVGDETRSLVKKLEFVVQVRDGEVPGAAGGPAREIDTGGS